MSIARRTVLGLAAGLPVILNAQDKTDARRPIIGEGDHTYEVFHDWGELPQQIVYGNTHGVCEDSNGHIYVHHTVHAKSQSPDSIVVFDHKGKFVRSWGKQFKDGAHGLHIRREGRDEYLYICDQLHGIVTKRTLKGEEVWTIGYPSDADFYKLPIVQGNKPYRPTNVAIAPNGDVYVADGYGSYFINQYDQNAKYIRSFGGNGKEPGQLIHPHGLMVDVRSAPATLLIADRGNNRIQRFSLDGKPIEIISGTLWPCHFHERNGDVVVPDLQSRVTLLDRNSHAFLHLGDSGFTPQQFMAARQKARNEFTPGKFICPHGAIFDHEGSIFVVEWVEVGRVTKLQRVSA